MKVILSGGGTGGHVYPAVSIAKALEKEYKDIKIVFVGTEKGLENDIVPNAHYTLRKIHVRGFQRKLGKNTCIAAKEAFTSLFEVKKILKEEKPDLVIGTGGYVCGPVVLMAALSHIPTIIHEQNAFPGVTNKILSKFTDRVLITFKEASNYFKNKGKVKLVGNPLRDDFLNISIGKAIEDLGFTKDKPIILITGGSRGAKKINESVLGLAQYADYIGGIQIIHMTGKTQYEDVCKLYNEKNINMKSKNIHLVPYINNMPEIMKSADIIVSRCGAGAIAEITAIGKPSILIPFPYATDNHQEYNARALEKEGAAILILEEEMTPELLCYEVLQLARDKELQKKLSQNSKKVGRPEAAQDIVKIIKELMLEKGR